jgi:hypothetical protein
MYIIKNWTNIQIWNIEQTDDKIHAIFCGIKE